jgi:hypothetical protein
MFRARRKRSVSSLAAGTLITMSFVVGAFLTGIMINAENA